MKRILTALVIVLATTLFAVTPAFAQMPPCDKIAVNEYCEYDSNKVATATVTNLSQNIDARVQDTRTNEFYEIKGGGSQKFVVTTIGEKVVNISDVGEAVVSVQFVPLTR